MQRKAEQYCEKLRKTKKHKPDGRAHDVVFIINRFIFVTTTFSFFFRVWDFIVARKTRQAPTKNKKTDHECMIMTLLEAEYSRLTLETERGISLPV